MFQFINEYFRYEYKTYLTEEFKRNKHLHPDAATPTVAPVFETAEKSFDLSPDDAKSFITSQKVKTCRPNPTRTREELDYCNQQKTNDRQSQDDDGFLSYWLDPKRKDNAADNNPLCRADCGDKDNAPWSASFAHKFFSWPTCKLCLFKPVNFTFPSPRGWLQTFFLSSRFIFSLCHPFSLHLQSMGSLVKVSPRSHHATTCDSRLFDD